MDGAAYLTSDLRDPDSPSPRPAALTLLASILLAVSLLTYSLIPRT
jgi:hypothetical protein